MFYAVQQVKTKICFTLPKNSTYAKQISTTNSVIGRNQCYRNWRLKEVLETTYLNYCTPNYVTRKTNHLRLSK